MALLMTRPTRHPRTGIYWVRKAVPPALREIVGRRELIRSLKTKDPAEAKRLAPAAVAEFDGVIAEARQRLAAPDAPVQPVANIPTEAEIRAAVMSWFHAEERRRITRPDPEDPEEAVANLNADAASIAHPEQGWQYAEPELRRILVANGLAAAPDQLRAFGVELVRAVVLEGLARERDRLMGRGASSVHDPALSDITILSDPPSPPSPRAPRLTVKRLIERYQSAPERQHLSERNGVGYALGFRALREVLGEDKEAGAVTRDDAREVMALILKTPVAATNRYPDLTLAQAAEKAAADKAPVLAPRTAVNVLANLSALWRWGEREAGLPRNPFAGLSTAVKKGAAAASARRPPRRPFTPAELKVIFTSERYQSKPDAKDAGKWWVPVICLYSGLRLNEAAQLDVADVEDVDGVPMLLIRASGTEGKSVKNANSTRALPVHPELIRLGFLDHVETQRKARQKKVFPELKAGSMDLSRAFRRFLDGLGVTERGIATHAFRHGFRDRLRAAEVPSDIADALCGWREKGQGGAYGLGYSARILLEHLARVEYRSVDLSRIAAVG